MASDKEMEFSEKLQKLRKKSNLTQEGLAEKLFVSRVTVSKWETGRGYPNLDSLKAMAQIFNVSIDELLCEENKMESVGGKPDDSKNLVSLILGLVDFSTILLLFCPFFLNHMIKYKVVLQSLIKLECQNRYVKYFLIFFVSLKSFYGVLELSLQSVGSKSWEKISKRFSFVFSVSGIILFIMTNQQDPALFMLFLVIAKILLLRKVT